MLRLAVPSTRIKSLPVHLILRTAHFTHVLDVGGQPLSLLIVISESDSPHVSCHPSQYGHLKSSQYPQTPVQKLG